MATAGNTTIESTTYSIYDTNNCPWILVYTGASYVEVNSLKFYGRNGDPTDRAMVKACVWNYSGSLWSQNTLVKASVPYELQNNSWAWVTVPFDTSFSLSPSTYYYIGFLYDWGYRYVPGVGVVNSGPVQIRWRVRSSWGGISHFMSYDSPGNLILPFTASFKNNYFSMYMDYATSSSSSSSSESSTSLSESTSSSSESSSSLSSSSSSSWSSSSSSSTSSSSSVSSSSLSSSSSTSWSSSSSESSSSTSSSSESSSSSTSTSSSSSQSSSSSSSTSSSSSSQSSSSSVSSSSTSLSSSSESSSSSSSSSISSSSVSSWSSSSSSSSESSSSSSDVSSSSSSESSSSLSSSSVSSSSSTSSSSSSSTSSTSSSSTSKSSSSYSISSSSASVSYFDIDVYKMTRNTYKSIEPYLKEARFGDGYKQLIGSGYVALKEQWNVEFVPLVKATADALESSLLATKDGRLNYLRITMPNETSYKFYSADNVTRVPISPTLWTITCTMKMEFEE